MTRGPSSGVRPLPAPVGLLYLAVLCADAYVVLAGLAGPAGTAVAGVAAGLLTLAGLDAAERRGLLPGRGRGAAVVLLAGRLVTVETVAALDASGTATLLRLVVTFWAHFALGPRAARVVAAGYGLALLARATLGLPVAVGGPGGWADPRTVAAVLMSAAGLVVTLVTASLVARLDDARRQAALSAAATERTRLARDVHDGVGHHLTAVALQLQKAEAFVGRDPEVASRAIRDARAAAAEALAEVRRSMATLRDADLFELRSALDALSAGPSAAAGPVVRLDVRGTEHAVPTEVLLTVYRLVQEALTNVRRHARAGQARVFVELDDHGGARLTVTDDGCGFAPSAPSGGSGLAGMRARVELLGGRLSVTSAPGRGTTVDAWVPPVSPAARR